MFVKILVLSAFVAAGQGELVEYHPGGYPNAYVGYNSYQAPIYGHGHGYDGYKGDYYAHPKYKYSYGVNDPHSGDHKSQAEYRDGDVVRGHYTVADPDGTLRVVHYTADDKNGFNAIVEKHGHSVHPEPIIAAPLVAAPVVAQKVIYEKPVVYPAYGGYGNYGYGPHGY